MFSLEIEKMFGDLASLNAPITSLLIFINIDQPILSLFTFKKSSSSISNKILNYELDF